MNRGLSARDVLLEVLTPLDFRVHVTRARWELIVSIEHPVMAGHQGDLQEALAHPAEVWQNRSDPEVYLFYKVECLGRWVCLVAKRLSDHGFLITAYPTDAVKEGVQVWPR